MCRGTPPGDHHDVGGLHRFIAVGCVNGEAILRGNDARLFGAQLHLKTLFRRHFVTENNARHREVERAEIFHGNNGDVKRLHTSPLWILKRQGFAIFRHVNKLRNLVVAGVLFQGRAGQQTVVNRLHVGRHNLCFGQREVGF